MLNGETPRLLKTNLVQTLIFKETSQCKLLDQVIIIIILQLQ